MLDGQLALPTAAFDAARTSYVQVLERLCEASVTKQHDPYTEIDWSAPRHRIEADDPRFMLPPDHALAQTDWYQALDDATRSRFGLTWAAQLFKNGIRFEAALGRGLLAFTQTLPDGSPEYRYVMHEVVEEARHSMMFQEFIRRAPVTTWPTPRFEALLDDFAVGEARGCPELFFFTVLAGEIFIDEQNRRELRRPKDTVHPLLRRVIQIHVTEEARHVCFAEHYLREHLGSLSAPQRERTAWIVPVICGHSSSLMLVPDRRLARQFGLSRQVIRRALGRGTEFRRGVNAVVAPIQRLCAQHGMLQPRHLRMWRVCGFEAPDTGAART